MVGGVGKIADKFVGKFLTHEGESVEEAKARLAAEKPGRQQAAKTEAEKRAAAHPMSAGSSGDIAKASVEAAKASVEAGKNAGKRH